MFSRRLNWSQRPNPISELLEAKRRTGAAVLDLTESNPTRAGLTYPDAEILAAFSDPRWLHYDPSPAGLYRARAAVAKYYADRGANVDPSRILLTASTSEAYAYLFKLLADPGGEILVPRPSYPLFEFLAALESVRLRPYPLRYDGRWHIDFPALELALSPATRAIVVVNPNNPTGSFLKCEELARLEAIAHGRDLAILSDEVFSDYGFQADPTRVSTLSTCEGAMTFSMSGLSKVAGMPQVKLGWIVASGPGHAGAMERLEWIADTYLSVAAPVQVALPRLFEVSAGVQAQIRERTRGNLRQLKAALGGSAVNVRHSEGGWYAVLQMPRTRSEEEWALALLGEHDVLVQPGFFFDFETEAFLVVSLLTETETFLRGVECIRESASCV